MRNKVHRFERNNRDAFVFLIPWMLGIGLLTIFPICWSFFLSFTQYDLLSSPEFIGLGNFQKLFKDTMFWKSLGITFKYVLLGVPLSLIMALFMALILYKDGPIIKEFRALYYLPSLLGGSVAISVLWRVLFSQQGLLNEILTPLGIEAQSWIGDPRYAIYTLILLRVWQFGSPMLICISGIKQIPESLYESASLEGTNRFQKFWHITFPMLSPIILFNGIMSTISAFQDFTPAYIISGGTGGPMGSTMLYSLYLYQKAFTSFQMGYAAAMAWVLLIIIALFTGVLFKFSESRVYYES